MSLIGTLLEFGMAVAVVPIKMTTRGIELAQSILDEGKDTMSDADYCRYRMYHPVSRVLRESSREFIVETVDGHKEKWIKPKWGIKSST